MALSSTTKEISLELAHKDQKELMKNLMALYLHDLSSYVDDLEINQEGFLEYDGLDLFWEKKELIPLLIHYKGNVIGFVLLASPPYAPKGIDICIHEFFILRKYRKLGLGTKAIEELMQQYKGKYYVMQLEKNKPALEFWRNLYKKNPIDLVEKPVIQDGCKCIAQTFSIV